MQEEEKIDQVKILCIGTAVEKVLDSSLTLELPFTATGAAGVGSTFGAALAVDFSFLPIGEK